jgi:DNA-binding response OmpR family regulator
MAALRKKLEDDPNHPKHILSVRGIGYRLDQDLSES